MEIDFEVIATDTDGDSDTATFTVTMEGDETPLTDGFTMTGGTGDEVIVGSVGNDVIDGGGGNDEIFGGAGNDVLDGGSGNDIIDGGAGDDTIDGGAGNDIIDGGGGNDAIDGGTGDDIAGYEGLLDGHDVISDFEAGVDVIDLDGLFDVFMPAADEATRDATLQFNEVDANTVEVTVSGLADFSITVESAAPILQADVMAAIDTSDA